ncbi:uncharacterized protein ARMOST_19035 [Armillaria ostoyae]|uniref:Uncharacterized protein n=1 Tax=Armillaria ostoyae TaxID=47428 RepID=A0A284S3H4_ARMOS|nr:uncharacterized protein ARMOST_19035 [Armillaria ostoyae]
MVKLALIPERSRRPNIPGRNSVCGPISLFFHKDDTLTPIEGGNSDLHGAILGSAALYFTETTAYEVTLHSDAITQLQS